MKGMIGSGFSFLRQPRVLFGPGRIDELPGLASLFGKRMLLVTGGRSLEESGMLQRLLGLCAGHGVRCDHARVTGEPSPEVVDGIVERFRAVGIAVVAGVGGGSVIDAAKAVSAMLLQEAPVERFIEGREGFLVHDGRKVPFIAAPTTAGTGSEATSNAVISRIGRDGFKRSLRHDAFVPDIALVDPVLHCSAPRNLTLSSGMDALTQLLEAYLSPSASPLSDCMAWSGLEYFARSFLPACGEGSDDVEVRAGMAYAALVSGIALANAGLGIVHGFASSIGGRIDIPHGELCATLLYTATRENISALQESGQGEAFLEKFSRAGCLLSGRSVAGTAAGCEALLEQLELWQEQLGFRRLREFGLERAEIEPVVAATRAKNNPVDLDNSALKTIVEERW
ncbi:iron-containing alcohol dehydrogenase [Prosthecochloris sp. CIB 2401]|uniref:iron-containing alcohol dehydrogenase n=1 Tax=Prosthecochloris sp. CIB 2401 TaxID=1868325 RepID=UPI00080AC025|nr:iron-containing alcohol dehydrogenase [Prosthecochloris sp. CIB 2401]ANT65020.1 Ethanolamine utilization protein EutG [Prosthecochloris sp. CIB 2401]